MFLCPPPPPPLIRPPCVYKGCQVFANDLNPQSAHYLRINAALNKAGARCMTFNLDARAFVRLLLAERAPPPPTLEGEAARPAADDELPSPVMMQHAIMNLPASAPEFLDSFRGAFGPAWRAAGAPPLPLVHCYCFAKGSGGTSPEEAKEAAVVRAETALGGGIDRETLVVTEVRNVAPNKTMLCLSFRVPREVAFMSVDAGGALTPGAAPADDAPSSKRPKVCDVVKA